VAEDRQRGRVQRILIQNQVPAPPGGHHDQEPDAEHEQLGRQSAAWPACSQPDRTQDKQTHRGDAGDGDNLGSSCQAQTDAEQRKASLFPGFRWSACQRHCRHQQRRRHDVIDLLADLGDKVDASAREEIQGAIKDIREALDSEDAEDIKRRAGKKKVVLELGGNAGVIVHADADIPLAAERCVAGGFGYAGQTCISVQRILVERPAYGKFRDLLLAGVNQLTAGDPMDEATDVGGTQSRKTFEGGDDREPEHEGGEHGAAPPALHRGLDDRPQHADESGDRRREEARDHHLLEQAAEDKPCGASDVDVPWVAPDVELRDQLVRSHDGPGDEVREERQEEAVVEERAERFAAAEVDVDRVAERLERVEADPERQDDAEHVLIHGCMQTEYPHEFDVRVRREIEVLEEGEDAEVAEDGGEERGALAELRRRLFHSRPAYLGAMIGEMNALPARRSLFALTAVLIMFMIVTVAFTSPSFASGLEILLHGARGGVYQVNNYPSAVGHHSVPSNGKSNRPREISLSTAQNQLMHFPIYWPTTLPQNYGLTGIYLYP